MPSGRSEEELQRGSLHMKKGPMKPQDCPGAKLHIYFPMLLEEGRHAVPHLQDSSTPSYHLVWHIPRMHKEQQWTLNNHSMGLSSVVCYVFPKQEVTIHLKYIIHGRSTENTYRRVKGGNYSPVTAKLWWLCMREKMADRQNTSYMLKPKITSQKDQRVCQPPPLNKAHYSDWNEIIILSNFFRDLNASDSTSYIQKSKI